MNLTDTLQLIAGAGMIAVGSLLVTTSMSLFGASSDAASLPARTADTEPSGAPPALVVFHANWCGHCKTFMPQWPDVARSVSVHGVAAHAFEADTHKEIVDACKVQGYPTIRLYPRGFSPVAHHVAYNGPRSPEAIAAWVRAQLGA